RPHPPTTPFPYTTLFRSRGVGVLEVVPGAFLDLLRVERTPRHAVVLGGVRPVLVVGREQVDGRLHLLDAVAELVDSEEAGAERRSEEHTSELQSRFELVC